MPMFAGSPESSEGFQKSLFECMRDLNKLVPGLSQQYSEPVILAVLAEEMGAGLRIMLRKKWCDRTQVRGLLRSVEAFAFHDPDAPGGAPGLQPDSTH